jgi:enterochelin esterase-like enzyme
LFIVAPMVATLGFAQQPPVSGPGGTSLPVRYPEIRADRRVTFLLPAPGAREVVLRNTTAGCCNQWPEGNNLPMHKDDQGVWSLTIGPLEPEFYTYVFVVDGVNALDPGNPLVSRDGRQYSSRLEVSGQETARYEYRDVPHGTVAHVYAPWPSLGIVKRMTVYTPPGYEKGTERYPVLYLQHGGGGDEDAWTELGRAPEILDSLIAQGKAKPMIVVMSNIYWDQKASQDYIPVVPPPGGTPDLMKFPPALARDLIPFIDETYRTRADPGSRAIAGLSRGGMHSLAAAFNNLDKFAWVGSFSSGLPLLPGVSVEVPPPADADRFQGSNIRLGIDPGRFLALLPQLNASANSKLNLLYVGIGSRDGLITSHRALHEILKSRGINAVYKEVPGYGHEWPYWRVALQDFVPRLFQTRPEPR